MIKDALSMFITVKQLHQPSPLSPVLPVAEKSWLGVEWVDVLQERRILKNIESYQNP